MKKFIYLLFVTFILGSIVRVLLQVVSLVTGNTTLMQFTNEHFTWVNITVAFAGVICWLDSYRKTKK